MLILANLHWLSVAARIDYKVALITLKAMTTERPGYLRELPQVCRPMWLSRTSGRVIHEYVTTVQRQYSQIVHLTTRRHLIGTLFHLE
jgi:hypothetical protein